jgi:hypothetical protein
MSQLHLDDALALLSRTPTVLDALLRGLPPIWTDRNEGEGTWNVRAVLAHLIEADRVNWLARARHILEYGEARSFEPFNREAGSRENQSLAELLDEFTRQRAQKLAELRALHVESPDLGRHGHHPALGAVTLSQLLAAWAAHDLTHLHQISRILAHQYRDAVGPWSKFLGVLHCQGHSQPA